MAHWPLPRAPLLCPDDTSCPAHCSPGSAWAGAASPSALFLTDLSSPGLISPSTQQPGLSPISSLTREGSPVPSAGAHGAPTEPSPPCAEGGCLQHLTPAPPLHCEVHLRACICGPRPKPPGKSMVGIQPSSLSVPGMETSRNHLSPGGEKREIVWFCCLKGARSTLTATGTTPVRASQLGLR